jgi:hypothetical protein
MFLKFSTLSRINALAYFALARAGSYLFLKNVKKSSGITGLSKVSECLTTCYFETAAATK